MHYYSEKQDSELRLIKCSFSFKFQSLEFYLASGVFSKTRIDKGTELLLNSAIIQPNWNILDLGCGDGIIGISIAKVFPNSKVLLSDINERAVATTQKNIELNKIKNAKVKKSNIFINIKQSFDTILLNPPQSAGKDVCFNMITQSKNHLNKNGLLQIVARNKKGGKSLYNKMYDTFKNCLVIAKSGGFWVYVSKNA